MAYPGGFIARCVQGWEDSESRLLPSKPTQTWNFLHILNPRYPAKSCRLFCGYSVYCRSESFGRVLHSAELQLFIATRVRPPGAFEEIREPNRSTKLGGMSAAGNGSQIDQAFAHPYSSRHPAATSSESSVSGSLTRSIVSLAWLCCFDLLRVFCSSAA